MTVVTAGAGAAVYETEAGRLALLDQWERTASAFGHEVDDAEYERLQALSEFGARYAVAKALAYGPGLAFAIASLVFLASRRSAAPPAFVQTLAVVVHADTILALRDLIAAPLTFLRETTASAATVGVLVPMLDEASPAARLFAMLDVFVIWWLAVLALGVSVLLARPAARTAMLLFGLYLATAVAATGAMAWLGGTT